MTQLDICRTRGKGGAPYLVILQSDLAAPLETVVVAPLWPLTPNSVPVRKLQPVVAVNGSRYLLSVQELLSIPRSALGPVVGNIHAEREALIKALDLLFIGY